MTNSISKITREYRNIIILVVGTMTLTLGAGIWNEFLVPFLLNIHETYPLITVGIAFLAYVLPIILSLILLPIMGKISDGFGRKRMIVLALFAYSMVNFLYPMVVVFPLLYFVAIAAVLQSLWSPAFSAGTADSVSAGVRGKAFGATAVTTGLASLVAPALGSAIFSGLGFLGVFSIGAIIVFSGAVICLAFLAEPKNARSTQESRASNFGSPRNDLRNDDPSLASEKKDPEERYSTLGLSIGQRRVTIITLICISFVFSSLLYPVSVSLALILFEYSVDSSFLNSASLWFALLGIISVGLGGVLADSRGRKRTLLHFLGIGLVLGLFALLLLIIGSVVWYLVAMQSLIVIIEGAISPVVSALIADITPPSRRGLTYGLFAAGFGIGQSLTTFALGLFSVPLLTEPSVAFFALTLLFIIIAIILVNTGVEEPKGKL